MRTSDESCKGEWQALLKVWVSWSLSSRLLGQAAASVLSLRAKRRRVYTSVEKVMRAAQSLRNSCANTRPLSLLPSVRVLTQTLDAGKALSLSGFSNIQRFRCWLAGPYPHPLQKLPLSAPHKVYKAVARHSSLIMTWFCVRKSSCYLCYALSFCRRRSVQKLPPLPLKMMHTSGPLEHQALILSDVDCAARKLPRLWPAALAHKIPPGFNQCLSS